MNESQLGDQSYLDNFPFKKYSNKTNSSADKAMTISEVMEDKNSLDNVLAIIEIMDNPVPINNEEKPRVIHLNPLSPKYKKIRHDGNSEDLILHFGFTEDWKRSGGYSQYE